MKEFETNPEIRAKALEIAKDFLDGDEGDSILAQLIVIRMMGETSDKESKEFLYQLTSTARACYELMIAAERLVKPKH